MRKLLLLSFLCFLSFAQLSAQTESAKDAVKNMGLGWNLGNTLDANNGAVKSPSEDGYWNCQGLESETCWGQYKATKELITMMKNAGFGAIRVPVTWYQHIDKDGNINKEWLARVREVVDYVIDNDLYCIINVHHDTGADSENHESWIKADMDNYNANKARFENLWKQIATEFKDYDGKLLFGAFNEMLDVKNSWCYASMNATGQYDEKIAKSAYDAINSYAQSFVDAVRSVGGNNSDRNLIINTYCAASGLGNWKPYLKDPLKNLAYPKDSAKEHIIFEFHAYPELVRNGQKRSISDIKKDVDEYVDNAKTHLMSKGAPVIIGEWGSSNVDKAGATDYDLHKDLYFQFVDYFIQQMKANGIGTFYWMGLSDAFFRSLPVFNQADLAERMAKAYHGSDFKGEYPTMDEVEEIVVWEDKLTLEWGTAISVPADLVKTFDKDVRLNVTYTQDEGADYSMLQFWYGDWSEMINFNVDEKTYSADFVPGDHYGTPQGTQHTTTFTFDEATYETILKKGVLFQGHGITVTKVTLSDSSTSSLNKIHEAQESDIWYNIFGQPVSAPTSGIYIHNGKTVLVK